LILKLFTELKLINYILFFLVSPSEWSQQVWLVSPASSVP